MDRPFSQALHSTKVSLDFQVHFQVCPGITIFSKTRKEFINFSGYYDIVIPGRILRLPGQ